MEIISKYKLDLRYLLENESHLEYVGDIGADGKLHGNGTIKNENITINGYFIDGSERVDKCSIVVKDGLEYDGDVDFGMCSGKACVLKLPCNNKYIGDMKYGLPNGVGRFLYSDGSYYLGNWDNGLKEGVGMHINKDENYIGSWKMGEKHGNGISVVCNVSFNVTNENGIELTRATKKELENETLIKSLKKDIGKKNEIIANLQVKLLLKEGYLESLEKITIDDFCDLNLKINEIKERLEVADKKITDYENVVNCKVCYTNISNIIIKPCNHLVLCSECNESARISTGNRCPLCKETCDETFRVYW